MGVWVSQVSCPQQGSDHLKGPVGEGRHGWLRFIWGSGIRRPQEHLPPSLPGAVLCPGVWPLFAPPQAPAGSHHHLQEAPWRTVLFQRERTGLTYRVPALLLVPPGPTLLAFAEQRLSPNDSHAHRLVLRRGTLAGGSVQVSGQHRSIATGAILEGHRSMNPCPVLDTASGTVFLFFIAVLGHTPEAVQIATGRNAARLREMDSGQSWAPRSPLTSAFLCAGWATFAVGPGHGVQLRSGRLLVPAYTYRVDRRECFGKICWTSPHAFAFYSDDHGRTWHSGGLVSNLRSGECQFASVDGGFLYCNARSPLGSRVQALSPNEGTSFLPGELVPTLAETSRGCQGSIVGFPAPTPGRPQDEGQGAWIPMLRLPSAAPPQSPTWLLYSHPAGRRARLHMGIYLSRSPLDPHSWTKPWVIYEGPSGYSDLAFLGPVPGATPAFACLFESGARVSYEEISFCMFSLPEILENVPVGLEPPPSGDKPRGHCRPS
uniref:exo-alpha-sialidase n=1 Tax=Spermophilus dauricus TaxID=99837 RepID=A0A8C9Q480_SPEDA